jgi:hypothetical protein
MMLPRAPCAYPLEGYESTGIGRLEVARRIEAGTMSGSKQPSGALLGVAQVDLRLTDRGKLELPPADPKFTRAVVALLGDKADRYQMAVLDLTDRDRPRYAAHYEHARANVGSVGKLLVALAIFQALADLHPDDVDARRRLLRDTTIIADEFIYTDHHTVRMWKPESEELIRRPLALGDSGNLWEWMDWMLSASSNAAGATLMKHAMLITRFGRDYPVPHEQGTAFFEQTPRGELGTLLARTMQEPVRRNGFDLDLIRQGSFFTATGNRKVPGTTSYATPRTLMQFLLRMEQGRLVDAFSSRELKRLLYVTERRIRYASSPTLWKSAVYFKSGSLYQCKPEPGFQCLKYHGNVKNYMNSVAIIESPAGEMRHYYMVALMSNVLRRNSAVDHQTLATRLHELITTGKVTTPPMVDDPLPSQEPQTTPPAVEAASP